MSTTNELAKLAQLLTVNNSSVDISDPTGNTSLSVSGSNISPVQSFRNKIINGNFDIWQRGTSTSTSSAFVADRFYTDVTGCTFTSSRQSFTLGQTDVPGEPIYWYRTVVTSVAGASNYCRAQQRIESVRTLAGKTATISFWAKADASKNIAIEFYQNFGTGGSPSTTVDTVGVTTCALTTTWQKFTATVSIPSISGKTLGSNSNDFLGLLFWFNAGSTFNSRTNSLGQQSGTFDIAQVQVEEGPVATPFEMRPYATELNLCERYYQFVYPFVQLTVAAWIAYYGGSNAYCPRQHFPKMRTAPTATVLNNSNVQYYSYAGSWAATSISVAVYSNDTLLISVTTDGDGRGKLLRSTSGTPTITLSAEL